MIPALFEAPRSCATIWRRYSDPPLQGFQGGPDLRVTEFCSTCRRRCVDRQAGYRDLDGEFTLFPLRPLLSRTPTRGRNIYIDAGLSGAQRKAAV